MNFYIFYPFIISFNQHFRHYNINKRSINYFLMLKLPQISQYENYSIELENQAHFT